MRKLHVDVAASLGGHDRLSTHDLSKFRYIRRDETAASRDLSLIDCPRLECLRKKTCMCTDRRAKLYVYQDSHRA